MQAGNNDNDTPNLVSRISWNDPELTHLALNDVVDVMDTSRNPNIHHLDNDGLDMNLVDDRIDRTIEALSRNHTITSVRLDGYFGFKAGYSTS
jgi:hypothetical protein